MLSNCRVWAEVSKAEIIVHLCSSVEHYVTIEYCVSTAISSALLCVRVVLCALLCVGTFQVTRKGSRSQTHLAGWSFWSVGSLSTFDQRQHHPLMHCKLQNEREF